MTKTDVANMAFDLLGLPPIAGITANNVNAKKASRMYDVCAAFVLTQYPAKEAITFETVVDEATDSYTSHDTNNVAGGSTFEATAAIEAHTPRTGTLKITYSGDLYDEVDYASWTVSIFTLASGETLARTYDNGDTMTLTPNNKDWEYMYDLPTDSLKILDINGDGDTRYYVEGAYLYTNAYDSTYGVVIRYIKDIRAEVSSSVVYPDELGVVIASCFLFMGQPPSEKGLFKGMFDDTLREAVWTSGDESEGLYADYSEKLWSES